MRPLFEVMRNLFTGDKVNLLLVLTGVLCMLFVVMFVETDNEDTNEQPESATSTDDDGSKEPRLLLNALQTQLQDRLT